MSSPRDAVVALHRIHRKICRKWIRGLCNKRSQCPWIHNLYYTGDSSSTDQPLVRTGNTRPPSPEVPPGLFLESEVCRNWLRGLCKNGFRCKYRHSKSFEQSFSQQDFIDEVHLLFTAYLLYYRTDSSGSYGFPISTNHLLYPNQPMLNLVQA